MIFLNFSQKQDENENGQGTVQMQPSPALGFAKNSSAGQNRMGENRACTNFRPSILNEGTPVYEQHSPLTFRQGKVLHQLL